VQPAGGCVVEARAPPRREYIPCSFSRLPGWTRRRVKLATSGHIRRHRLLQNSLSITAGRGEGEINNRSVEISKPSSIIKNFSSLV
jgi:hypothetical protein